MLKKTILATSVAASLLMSSVAFAQSTTATPLTNVKKTTTSVVLPPTNTVVKKSPVPVSVTTSNAAVSGTFIRNLAIGSTGADVLALQHYLNTHDAVIATTGAGSMGMETSTFGSATKAALIKFQIANNITPASGYFGQKTRMLINSGSAINTSGSNAKNTTTPVVPATKSAK